MTGVLILNKPEGFTSFDAVAVLRRLTGERKIGHTGTLDPMATGVLPMLLGKATRAIPFLEGREKTYRAGFRLGVSTDTLDRTGKVLETDETPVTRGMLEAALPAFRGEILQVPPMYSALQKDGVRLYDLARQGIEVERKARPVTVYRLELCSYEETAREGELLLTCSQGTYVRTLCDDLGRAVGSHGVMTALERTEAAGFSLGDALPLEEARAMDRGALLGRLLPVETLFRDLPAVKVSAAQAQRYLNGGWLCANRLGGESLPDGTYRVLGPQSAFLGLGALQDEKLGVLRIFAEKEESGL